MDRFRALLREPALLLDAFESAVVLAVALGVFSLTGEAQRDLIALFIAVLAFAKAFLTKPFPVTVVPDLGRAALVFFGSVQLTHLSADQITLVATFLGTTMTLFQRAQITPRFDAVVEPGGAGAGPVRGEAGLAALGVFGIVLIALGLLFLVMLAVAHSPIPLIWAILILVIGVVLFVYDGRGTSHRL